MVDAQTKTRTAPAKAQLSKAVSETVDAQQQTSNADALAALADAEKARRQNSFVG